MKPIGLAAQGAFGPLFSLSAYILEDLSVALSLSSLSSPGISILFLSPSLRESGSPSSFSPPSHWPLTTLLIDHKRMGVGTFSVSKQISNQHQNHSLQITFDFAVENQVNSNDLNRLVGGVYKALFNGAGDMIWFMYSNLGSLLVI